MQGYFNLTKWSEYESVKDLNSSTADMMLYFTDSPECSHGSLLQTFHAAKKKTKNILGPISARLLCLCPSF